MRVLRSRLLHEAEYVT